MVVTRNRSIYVKTLHMLLGIQTLCSHVKLPIDLNFVRDANKDKMETLKRKLKDADRVLWIEYGVSCDRDSVQNFIKNFDGFSSIVFPVVKEGVDWDMFKRKLQEGSEEPSEQKGLTFDTDVTPKKVGDYYPVTKTEPSLWAMDTKNVLKKIKDKKSSGKGLVLPPTIDGFFEMCLKKNVKIVADANAKTFNHFTHECVGNLMNISGLKVTK